MNEESIKGVIERLESAGHCIMASPALVTTEQRQQADQVFIEFKRSKFPYEICQQILQRSSSTFVLFQMGSTIKEATLREWCILKKDLIDNLRKFILEYVTSNPSLILCVREELLDALAVIIKRGSVESNSLLQQIFLDINNLFQSNQLYYQLVACSLLKAILIEFSSTSRSSAVGLSWEMHNCCKMQFEREHLKEIFLLVSNLLIQILQSPQSSENFQISEKLLSVLEILLNWEFLPVDLSRRHIGCFKGSPNPSLKPPACWKNVFLNPDLITLVVKLYSLFTEELKESCIRCLIQLASLNGNVFPDFDSKIRYLNHFINSILQIFKDASTRPSFAHVISNLIIFFPLMLFGQLDTSCRESLFNGMTEMTVTLGKEAELENSDEKQDAYRRLLDAWSRLAIEDFPLSPNHCSNIFESFLYCHLAPPLGCRPVANDEVILEEDEEDKDKFKDELCSIATLARVNLSHCLSLVNDLLIDRLSGKTPISLAELYEDLHWIVLVAAALLTDDVIGETPLIPSQIMQHAIDEIKSGKSNVNATISFVQGTSTTLESVDGIVLLVVKIQRLLEMCLEATCNNMDWSPQVAATCGLFLQRWVRTYLLPNEDNYTEMSPTFNTIWGCDAPISKVIVAQLVDICTKAVQMWSGEEQTLIECLHLLVILAERHQRAVLLLESEGFWSLIERLASLQVASLPSQGVRLICKAIVYAGTSHSGNTSRWTMYFENLRNSTLILRNDTIRKQELNKILELLCGVVEATTAQNFRDLFNFVNPAMEAGHLILNNFKDSPDVLENLFEFYSLIANRQLCYLSIDYSKKFYECITKLLEMYSKVNNGKIRLTKTTEEEQLLDLSLLMEILTHMLSKDFMDFFPSSDDYKSPTTGVVLRGLEIIMPMMNENLLSFPRLSSQYFKLIAYLSEMDAKLMLTSPSLQNVLDSLQLGLSSTLGTDVLKLCLEAIASLATVEISSYRLEPFMGTILQMVLLEPFEMDLLDTVADTIFSLISSNVNTYKTLVRQIVETQKEEEARNRLICAFDELTPNDEYFTNNRKNKTRFTDKFEEFVTNARAMLCIH
ncbi:DgyrCDS6171 [Dimorphilus gyrociliatus]|uniref:Exportin-4 n=1 Tax=Dimorphilus gyrociliatus TaxID=2664684 RepID=A0A7I8VQ29_9ANNE|nr:DgyrCDS6171 [Dimorphilus gyrociliatus]